jgi:hypothetical protein
MSAYHLATAFVKVVSNTTGLESGLLAAKNTLVGGLSMLSSLLTRMSAVGGGIGLGFAVKAASDAQEMNSMFEAVFKEQTAAATKFAEDFASRIGRSVLGVKEQMAGFQDTFIPLGFARDEARKLSEQLVKVTADLGSFKNRSDSDVAQILTAALTGERESLKSLGIVIQEVDVKNELMAMGMANAEGDILKQAKAQATLTLIMRGSADAMGDAERTSSGFANRSKAVRGALYDLTAVVGSAFIPALEDIATSLNNALIDASPRVQAFASNVSEWIDNTRHNWIAAFTVMSSYVRSWMGTLGELSSMISGSMTIAVAESTLKWLAFASAFGAVVVMIPKIVSGIKSIVIAVQSLAKASAMTQALQGAKGIAVLSAGLLAGYAAVTQIDKAFREFDKAVAESTAGDDVSNQTDAVMKAKQDAENVASKFATAFDVSDNKTIERDVKLKIEPLLSGFVDVASANEQIQEALLRQLDPQQKMVGLLEQGNIQQEHMTEQLRMISENTGRLQVLPAAT